MGPSDRASPAGCRSLPPLWHGRALGEAVDRARRQAIESERAEVASEVKRLVVDSGLTQQALADRIGTSRSRLSTYVSGKVVPSAALMVRMRCGVAAGRFARPLTGERVIHGGLGPAAQDL